MTYQHIGFIGLGLMGGSIARLIRQKDPSIRIFGFSRSDTTIQYALDHHIIDHGSTKKIEIPQDLDLVFICTPISLIQDYIVFLDQHILGHLLMTDVGSIKQGIGEGISFRKGHCFIGGHPMAGSEKTGIQYSDASLMKNATYILIPQQHREYTKFANFIRELDFRVLELNVEEHDTMVMAASHFPYLMAQLTVKNTEIISLEQKPSFQKVISTGFYDTTRVASSSVEWGMDVCRYNCKNLLKSLVALRENLATLEGFLKTQNWDALSIFLEKNKEIRDQLYL